MKPLHTVFVIALSLIIGLGSVTAVAHSHSDHQDTSCSVSVLQNASALIAAETSRVFVTNATTAKTIYVEKAISNRIRGCKLARAPPYNL